MPLQPEYGLQVKGLTAGYPSQSKPVIKDLAFALPDGSTTLLTGANGAGKSTLLHCLAGLLSARSGAIELPVGRGPPAYLSQNPEIDWNFPVTVKRFLSNHGRLLDRRRRSRPAQPTESLDRVGMGGREGDLIRELSGGERQRLRLARMLKVPAGLYLFDEPLNGIDEASRRIFADILENLRASGATLIVAAHDAPSLYGTVDGVVHLEDGRIAAREGRVFEPGRAHVA